MELADRGSLLDAIRREQYIEEPQSRRWFRQLLDAVEYCHDQGVVHRYTFKLNNYIIQFIILWSTVL